MVRLAVLLLLLPSCVRIGYESGLRSDDLDRSDQAPIDAAVPDAAPDILAPDTLAPDALATDALSPDTLAPDTLAPDTLAPDVLAPDVLAPPSCPAGMALLGDSCIDKAEGPSLTWVRAVEHCMSLGKRLCSESEWVAACNTSNLGLQDMTGGWEWIAELASDTSGKKRGYTDCTSSGSHDALSGAYGARCCHTLQNTPQGMAVFGGFAIDMAQETTRTWVRAAERCMDRGVRLCSQSEWVTACSSTGAGMQDMTGSWEWVYELASDTSGRKRGYTDCSSSSSHGATSGGYDTRCCYQKL